MRRFLIIFLALTFGLLAGAIRAETFKLATGQDLTGEMLPTSANEQGVQVKTGEGVYEKVPWTSFSQDDLRRFAQNPKLQPLVEPFIEITQEERIKKTEVPNVKEPPRLQRQPPRFILGAFFSSGLGLLIMLSVYAATIYAGYEVAIFRARPPYLVAGLSAIPFLGFLAPIIFLSMPTRMQKSADEVAAPSAPPPDAAAAPAGAAVAAAPASAVEADVDNPMQVAGAAHPAGLKLHHEEKKEAALPQTVTFQRGQFTFNRRFFETRFAGFFGVVRKDPEKDMVLAIKTMRGHYVTDRISRIAANDVHVQVHHGAASEEVMIPFQEIQEIKLQHKDVK